MASLATPPLGLGLPFMSFSWSVPTMVLEPNWPGRFWTGLRDAAPWRVHRCPASPRSVLPLLPPRLRVARFSNKSKQFFVVLSVSRAAAGRRLS